MNIRMNEGYIITDSIHIGDAEFVLGVSNSNPSMYVTWECKGGNYYFWGHYTTDLLAAKKDLLERAGQEIEIMERRKERQTPQKAKKERER